MPTTDSTALSPEPTFTDIGFPSGIPTMATARSVTGTRSQLNLATSQYFTDDTPGSEGASVMRRWTQIRGRVFYNASTDYEPPTIVSSEATRFGTNVGFEVSACTAVRVFILFDDLGDTAGAQDTWVGVDLLPDAPGSCRWTGGAPVIGPNVQYIVQACDADGNCAMSTNKAHYFQAQPEPADPPSGITIELAGTQAPGLPDYFSGPVQVDVTPADGAAVTIDGETPASLPATVTRDGLHVVEVDTAAGEHAEKRFVIDATAPQVPDHLTGAQRHIRARPERRSRVQVPRLRLRHQVVHRVDRERQPAPDGHGRREDAHRDGDRHRRPHDDRDPHLSRRVAVHGLLRARRQSPDRQCRQGGQLRADQVRPRRESGPQHLRAGEPGLRAASTAARASRTIRSRRSTPPRRTCLSYDAASQRYHYVWKTNKAWAGTCRQLIVTLVDGSTPRRELQVQVALGLLTSSHASPLIVTLMSAESDTGGMPGPRG